MVTYRQSLAMELARKLPGFACYLYVLQDADPNINDQGAFPRVICQLDSLMRLCQGGYRPYELIILDEMASLLQHFSAPTFRERAVPVLRRLEWYLNRSERIVAMVRAPTSSFLAAFSSATPAIEVKRSFPEASYRKAL